MKYRYSDDKYTVSFLKSRLQDNDGYCPSHLDSRGIEEYKCPCKDFRENTKKGETCACGLYVKVKN